MSTSALASPITDIATSVGAERRHGDDEQQRRRPQQHTDAEVGGDAARASPHQGHEAAEDAADAEHRAEQADARLAELEQVEGDAHLVDQRRAGDDRLRRHQRGDQAQVATGADRAEAGRGLPQDAELGLGRRLVGLVVGAGGVAARPPRGTRIPASRTADTTNVTAFDEVHDRDVGDRQQHTGDRRPGEEADALDRRRHDVGARQLARIARQLRQQGGLGRPERQREDGRERGRRRRSVAAGASAAISAAPAATTAARARSDQIITSRRGEAVGERREQRAEHRHHDVAGDAEHADGRRPALLVGPHRDRDRVGPVADRRTRRGRG